jgi:hypothetical protein
MKGYGDKRCGVAEENVLSPITNCAGDKIWNGKYD